MPERDRYEKAETLKAESGLDLEIIWEVIQTSLPELKQKLAQIGD